MKRFRAVSHPGPGQKKAREESRSCCINHSYTADSFRNTLSEAWRDSLSLKEDFELMNFPFQCCFLPNFISSKSPGADSGSGMNNRAQNGTCSQDGDFLQSLVTELLKLKFYEKNNDLYQFHQSDDLKKFNSPCITALRSLFHEECLPWLREVSGLELTDQIDMTCSKYEYSDTLLCHDDQLESRRIAFILYLVPDWSEKNGGSLDLFDTDDFGQPRRIVRSLWPVWNSLIFFDVSAKSFHQVSEVLCAGKTRLSINGWFHGPPSSSSSSPPSHQPHPLPMSSPVELGLEVLADWINPMYLDVGVQSQIQSQFEDDSQIELPDFLLEEKYQMLCEEMVASETETKWTVEGPPNRKHVHLADSKSLLPIMQAFMNLLHSKPFCLLLAHMTDLELAENVIKINDTDLKFKECSHHSSGTSSEVDKSPPSVELELNTRVELESNTPVELESSTPVESESNTPVESESNTPVELESNAPVELESNALCRGDLYHWCPRDYTLAGDPTDPGSGRFSLQATLCFNSEGWCEDFGGTMNYIAEDANEELLTICPTPNSLSLVYCDKDLLHFTKYLNHRSESLTCGSFYTASMTYLENLDETIGI